jgi:GxxExxY protein
MPIECQITMRPLDTEAFGKLSYDLYAQVLAIRKEMGRFFDEKIYKQALAKRFDDLLLEVPILVRHGSFRKFYYLDVLVAQGGVIEFKAAAALVARHRAQLLHYLMLVELWHGMLINVRPERMSKEYVNNVLTHAMRRQFEFVFEDWQPDLPGARKFESLLHELLEDWGTGLDLGLYEEGLTHFLGGDSAVIRPAEVRLDQHTLGPQTMRFVEERMAFKLTALESPSAQRSFEDHLRPMVNHTDIEGLFWANISRHKITLRCIRPEG